MNFVIGLRSRLTLLNKWGGELALNFPPAEAGGWNIKPYGLDGDLVNTVCLFK